MSSEMHRMIRQFVPREQWNDILQHRGWRPPTDVYDTDAAAVVKVEIAGIDKAERLLGWKPMYGGREGFRRGLSETIAWFDAPTNISRYKAGVYNI
jgi:nucleoside-diphosphate-sugar epimerase